MNSNSRPEGGKDLFKEMSAPESPRAELMRRLLGGYADLKARLSRKLGAELAADALQEMWLRLKTRKDIGPVKNADAYLYRATLYTGYNLRSRNEKELTYAEIEDILSVADEAPGPDLIAQSRADMALVEQALSDLSERQRLIFHEAFLGHTPNQVLAERYGVTVRTIQKELRRAVEHCAARLGREKSFVSGHVKLSSEQGEDI